MNGEVMPQKKLCFAEVEEVGVVFNKNHLEGRNSRKSIFRGGLWEIVMQ
jgi:hypothetical protein